MRKKKVIKIDEESTIIIIFSIILGVVAVGVGLAGTRIMAGEEYKDNKVIDRGIITEKNCDDSGWGPTDYYFEIDNSSDYQVSESDYNKFHVGDHVKIYASGRVEEID